MGDRYCPGCRRVRPGDPCPACGGVTADDPADTAAVGCVAWVLVVLLPLAAAVLGRVAGW